MLGDDPPYLSVGTEVSAKYKGAFCEAKIRKVVRSVKCRVTYKQGLGTATVADDQIKGTLRVGASVEARHGDRKEFVEATITKIQDCSQYTVVFDDGDITTLRRTALCLKSGRHFAESETLDQLPLTHPEHFGNPVIGGRRGRRSRQAPDESSEDEDSPPRGARDSGSSGGTKEGMETEPEIGKVVCVELGDKKKKDNWFPGLVVAPTAQDTVRIRVRDDYLVRSFKDARYYTVPKKEATEFTKELVNKVENSTLKVAVEKALLFLEKSELPPHWDRDSLFGHTVSSGNSDSDGELDSDSSDDEPREEKDHFVAQLYKFMDDRGTPINNCPMIGSEDIDLYRLFRAVYKLGGYNRVTNQNQWKVITRRLGFTMHNSPSTHNLVKQAYKKFLHSFEDFYRKLGCTMVNHPRGSIRKQRPGRSLIRDKDRNTPVPPQVPAVKSDKDEDEKKAPEDEKKEKKETKKDQVKEEEVLKIKKKEELEGNTSGQESDVNVEGETESSGSEKLQKSTTQISTLSSTSGGASSRAKPKSTKEDTKKKTIEKKKVESKKQEKKDDKPKEEEATKTRSKAKDDTVKIKSASEGRETRTPSREAEKKASKQRRLTDEELKKRGRKRKEYETEKSRVEEQLAETAPSYKGPVDLGDRLKVYYGPTHESKVTYEAKVIDIEKDGPEPLYLVHYTGWNTRYDEWIKASRIAQNFTQAQGRMKRIKAIPRPQTPSTNPSSNKSKGTCNSATNASQSRRRAQSVAPTSTSSTAASSTSGKETKKDEKEKDKEIIQQPTRSTTPLSFVSTSSRTKSPATPSNNRQTRTNRNVELSGTEHRRRTRRTSGHTDVSIVSESEDSEEYESDITEPEQAKTRLRGTEERKKKETRNRIEDRIKAEDDKVSDVEDDKDNLEEPRKGRRLRRTLGKSQGVKSEPDSDEEQPKGRDFDLNQIRSELKGFDKAVKLELIRMEPEPENEVKSDEKENVAVRTTSPKPEKVIESIKVENIVETKVENTEDIYEFKEPEPFEFEVRNKRDSGEKDKLKKRLLEEENSKSPKKKQKMPTMLLAKETKTEPPDNDNRKKPRKLFTKRSDDANETTITVGKSSSPSVSLSSISVTTIATTLTSSSQSTLSVCENAFYKLCESPSFNQLKSVVIEESVNKVTSSGANIVFSDLPADDEGMRDDSEDRLVISEPETLEADQESTFTYQHGVQFHNSESLNTTKSSGKIEMNMAIECTREEALIGTGNNKSSNNLDQKQNIKSSPITGPSHSELRILDHSKLLDITPALSPIVTPPVPISARLPATSTIEEKLSAMAFRNKVKDNKKTPNEDLTSDFIARKIMKESSKKADTILHRGKDSTSMAEIDNKKREQHEEMAVKEEEQRREIMRMTIKQKEEELQQLKLKKEVELKKFAETKTQQTVTEQKVTKLQEIREESWKRAENEGGKKSEEEYKTIDQTEKDRIDSHKKQISQDIIDSTDSSDSEQRLVIDNEEPQDVKVLNSSNFDAKLRAELDRLQDSTQDRYVRAQVSKNLLNAQQQQQFTEFKSSDITSVSKTDEEVETMNSLLCEEEIPGSPAPPSESIEQTSTGITCSPPKNEVTESSIVLMEMPFASAPTSSQSTTSSSGSGTVATLSMSKTVEDSVSLPMQQNVTLNVRQQQQQQQQQQLEQHQQHQQNVQAVLIPQQRRESSNEAAPVMDNTPPTTPDSSISNISGSPREERNGGSSPTSEDNIKLIRDSPGADNDGACKGPNFGSEDDVLLLNAEGNSADRALKPPPKRSVEDMQSPKKRKRSRKHSECGSGGTVGGGSGSGGVVLVMAPKKTTNRQNGRHGSRYGAGSDSDDTSEGSNLCSVNNTPTTYAITNVADLTATYTSSRPTKYNFYVELDPELDGSQRIAVLQQKLTELRKTYNAVKVELAAIERRRKKLRRREREAMKAAKAEMQQACS